MFKFFQVLLATILCFGLMQPMVTFGVTSTVPINISIDFTNARSNPGFVVTSWQFNSSGWTKQPELNFNNRTYKFNTPQEYVAALQKIKRFFRDLDDAALNKALDSVSAEFQAIRNFPINPKTPLAVPSVAVPLPQLDTAQASSAVGQAVDFSGIDLTNEVAVKALNGPMVKIGNFSIYAGFERVAGQGENPVLVAFVNGTRVWLQNNYETASGDSRAYGLIWAGGSKLYAIFSTTGDYGFSETDFRRFAKEGWLSDYGRGSGPQVAVVTQLDPATGAITHATYLSARLEGGATNALTVKGLSFNQENLVILADSWWAPRKVDRSVMSYRGETPGPFSYRIEFTPDLKIAVKAESPEFIY